MNIRLLFCVLATSFPAHCTPFTYQGLLTESGQATQGNYDLRFRIYGVANGGPLLAEPVYTNNVAMLAGHFVVSLEFGDGVLNGQPRWLEIAVRPAGTAVEYTTLTPRQPLSATPYAITALNVINPVPASINEIPATNFISGSILSPLRVHGESSTAGEIRVTGDEIVFSGDDASLAHNGIGLLLQAGSAMGPDKNGGNIILVPGVATGAGRSGRVVVDGALKITGPLVASAMIGDGSGIVNLAASNLNGVIRDQQLTGSYAGALQFINPANEFRGIFNGDGGGLTNLTASVFAGILPNQGLSGAYTNTLELSNRENRFNGAFTGAFVGDGSGLSNVTASGFTGVVPSAALSGVYANALDFSNPANQYYGSYAGGFVGDGRGLSNVTATALKGVLPNAGLTGTYSQVVNLSNAANTLLGIFSGDGSGLHDLPAAEIVGLLSSEHLAGTYSNSLRFINPSNQIAGVFQGDGTALTLSASRLSGALPNAGLSGTYDRTLNLVNSANNIIGVFGGNGAGVSNVNASTLQGLVSADFAQRRSSNFFSGAQTFAGPVVFSNNVSAETDLQVRGALSATTFSGNGGGLANLNASALTGSIPNIALSGTYANALSLPNPANNIHGSFAGDGSRLTNVTASNLTGVLASARLQGGYSNAVQFNNAANQFAGTFVGNGAGLTEVEAGVLTGVLPNAALAGTYAKAVNFPHFGNTFRGSFAGDGSGLSNVPFASLLGVLGDEQLLGLYSGSVQLNNSANEFNGEFTGDGSALRSLNASALSSGTIPDARLSANVAKLNSSPVFSGSVIAQDDLMASRLSVGSVGINTTNTPGRSLLVNGTAGITSSNTLEFGANVAGKQANAGKIGYQTFTPGALDIVGAGTNTASRKIKFWTEGGATLQISGSNALLMINNMLDESSSIALATPFSAWRFGQNKPPDQPDALDSFFIYQQSVAKTRFLITDTGRVGIGTNNPVHPLHLGNGAYCTAGGVWTSVSDRAAKEDFRTVHSREILAKVSALPITEWKYKVDTNGVRHLGPMAQDFYAAFGLGENDRTIGNVDADGIALAAIQGLNEVLKEKDKEIRALKTRNEEMEGRLKRLEALLGQNDAKKTAVSE